MKKYFFAMAAIVLAIGFSAFTTEGKIKKSSSILEDYVYWYESPDGATVGTIFYDGSSSGALAKDQLSSPPCSDNSGDVCLVGSDTPLQENDPIPGAATDNYMLKD